MKKRIAFVFNRMTIGGAEKALINLLRSFDTESYDISLFTLDDSGAYLDLLPSQVKIRYLKQINSQYSLYDDLRHLRIRNVLRGIYGRMNIRLHKDPYLKYMYTIRCFPPINEHFDIAIAYKFGWEDSATVLYRLQAKKNCAWVHGTVDLNLPRDKYTARFGRLMDALFCVSQEAKTHMDLKYPEFKEKTSVIHNIFDTQEIQRRSVDEKNVCFQRTALLTVGRLVDVKGQNMVPRTVRILLDKGHDIHWYLVGDGPLREKIQQERTKYDVIDRVHILGPKDNPYPYIRDCDIYVQPSFSEGYCTTTIEAKILHKPIVTTDAPGMREQFVSGENGLIVDAMTPEALAEGIATLLDHPALREKFVGNLKKESFDNSKELQKLYDFIEN